jgi:hypothetical protein
MLFRFYIRWKKGMEILLHLGEFRVLIVICHFSDEMCGLSGLLIICTVFRGVGIIYISGDLIMRADDVVKRASEILNMNQDSIQITSNFLESYVLIVK